MSLEQIYSEIFTIPLETITDDLALQKIPAWDSLTHMMLIVRIEETFQIQLTGDEIADIKTVGDARAALMAHGVSV